MGRRRCGVKWRRGRSRGREEVERRRRGGGSPSAETNTPACMSSLLLLLLLLLMSPGGGTPASELKPLQSRRQRGEKKHTTSLSLSLWDLLTRSDPSAET